MLLARVFRHRFRVLSIGSELFSMIRRIRPFED